MEASEKLMTTPRNNVRAHDVDLKYVTSCETCLNRVVVIPLLC